MNLKLRRECYAICLLNGFNDIPLKLNVFVVCHWIEYKYKKLVFFLSIWMCYVSVSSLPVSLHLLSPFGINLNKNVNDKTMVIVFNYFGLSSINCKGVNESVLIFRFQNINLTSVGCFFSVVFVLLCFFLLLLLLLLLCLIGFVTI